ncbi:class I SAM-dependent methyltransferase [Pseudonocardia sp. CA-107938]|uniref:class I SAM-dependent methyltransferase n=1 Tax=Pseudonocardia sp. CA-107938 TaxID=3240021 RepID=UPI003D8D817B
MTRRGAGKRVDATSLIKSFDAQARSYDRMVGADKGYHEHLRFSARRMGIPGGGAGLRLLDIGCGTGASTAALLDAAPEAEIVAVDASGEMLAQARRKTWTGKVQFVQGDVEDLERSVTGPFDGIMAAYLLRNVEDPNAALRAFYGLLRPGAPLCVHEYSVRDSGRSRLVWTIVSWGVIIPMAKLRTGDAGLYRYLWRSVLDFDGVEALATRMRACGFVDVLHQTMPGWQQHIVHTFLGRRPPGTEEDEQPKGFGNDAPTPPSGLDLTK